MEIIKHLPTIPKPTFTLKVSFEELVNLRDALEETGINHALYKDIDIMVTSSV